MSYEQRLSDSFIKNIFIDKKCKKIDLSKCKELLSYNNNLINNPLHFFVKLNDQLCDIFGDNTLVSIGYVHDYGDIFGCEIIHRTLNSTLDTSHQYHVWISGVEGDVIDLLLPTIMSSKHLSKVELKNTIAYGRAEEQIDVRYYPLITCNLLHLQKVLNEAI